MPTPTNRVLRTTVVDRKGSERPPDRRWHGILRWLKSTYAEDQDVAFRWTAVTKSLNAGILLVLRVLIAAARHRDQ